MSPTARGAWAAAVAVAVAAPVAVAVPAAAQEGDTTLVFPLEEIVVTSDRAETPLGTSIEAVTRIGRPELVDLPAANLAGVLRRVPGFALVDFDGLGLDPQPIVRGFYGGGEVEYVQVLLDGEPLNDVRAGLMVWDLVPPVAVEAVEVVRGGASALYGDAALGGVVNLVTRGSGEPVARWTVSGGSYGSWRGGGRWTGDWGGRRMSAYAGVLDVDGFRDHAGRRVGAAGTDAELSAGADHSLSITAHGMWRDVEEPGPLPRTALPSDGSASEPFYRHDGTREWNARVGLRGRRSVGNGTRVSGRVGLDLRRADVTRTIPLAPELADTRDRVVDTERLSGTVQLERRGLGLPWEDRLIAGLDASRGSVDSEYYGRASGDRSAYATDSDRGELQSRGTVDRTSGALFAQYEAAPHDAVRISLGARVDRLDDDFDPAGGAGEEAAATGHSALSPKAGVNLRWLRTRAHMGSLYVSVSRSFKAPTLDQLFDQRRVQVPFPPFEVTTSNDALDPQRSGTVEVGAYHDVRIGAGSVSLNAALYRTTVTNEIDFDVASLSYGNISESLHRGVEAGAVLRDPSGTSLFASYTLQDVEARVGPTAGRQLKAIPRHTLAAGASIEPWTGFEVGVDLARQSGAWIDDANTLPLEPFTTVDAHLTVGVAGARLSGEVGNVFDREYSTTAFPDPSGTDLTFHYPAAGRSLRLVLEADGPGR